MLDEDARHKRATSPLQVFDVKTPSVRAALEDAPKIGESLCARLPRAFRRRPPPTGPLRRSVRPRPDARPRARLLLAHDLRVHRAGRERQLDDLRRRPLRRARRADRRPADSRRSASAPVSSGSCSRSRTRASPSSSPGSTSSSSSTMLASRDATLQILAELRRCRHLRRHRLRRTVVQGPDDPGRPERRAHGRDRSRRRARRSSATGAQEQVVALDEVVATLTA